MVISVEELLTMIETDKTDSELELMLSAIEDQIRQYTKNNFVNRTSGNVEYPAAVKMAVVDMMKWKLRNEALNSDDAGNKPVASETISRHSVTYAQDSTDSDLDERFGVPKKYTAVLRLYERARF